MLNKLYAIIAAVIGVLMYGLKVRGDRYKHKADDVEEALVGAEAEGSIREYESSANARATATQRELDRIREEASHATDDTDAITTAVD